MLKRRGISRVRPLAGGLEGWRELEQQTLTVIE
jgi:3-mercaptopyruvate sulfurtransferase SseA